MAIEVVKTAVPVYQGGNTETAGSTESQRSTDFRESMAPKESMASKSSIASREGAALKESAAIGKEGAGRQLITESDVDREEKLSLQPTEALRKAVEEINKKAKNSEAVFGIHDATNRVTIKIIDKETKEVMKEYPPEQMLDMIAKAWELAGLLVDEKG